MRPKNFGSSTTPSLIFRVFSCRRQASGDSDWTPAVVMEMVRVWRRVKPPFVNTSQFSNCFRLPAMNLVGDHARRIHAIAEIAIGGDRGVEAVRVIALHDPVRAAQDT